MRLLRRARSEGGTVSHVDSDLPQVLEISSDDEVTEIPARPSTSLSSGLFVTPNPGERSMGTPDTRRRSTSALQARRASSAPRAASVLAPTTNIVDLTQEDSDGEAENRDDEKQEDKEEQEGATADETGRMRAELITGKKRNRRVTTSPPSEEGGDQKRQKPSDRWSLPLGEKQNWAFP